MSNYLCSKISEYCLEIFFKLPRIFVHEYSPKSKKENCFPLFCYTLISTIFVTFHCINEGFFLFIHVFILRKLLCKNACEFLHVHAFSNFQIEDSPRKLALRFDLRKFAHSWSRIFENFGLAGPGNSFARISAFFFIVVF